MALIQGTADRQHLSTGEQTPCFNVSPSRYTRSNQCSRLSVETCFTGERYKVLTGDIPQNLSVAFTKDRRIGEPLINRSISLGVSMVVIT